MFEYSQAELLEKIEKAILELNESQQKIDNQSILLTKFLTEISKAVKANKTVKVDNISRTISNSLDLKRPKWIEELKTDNKDLEKALSSVVQAIEMKEVVREVELKEASWLKKALKRNEPVQADYSKLLKDILTATKKEINFPKEMKVKGSVHVSNTLSIGKPTWYKPETYTQQLSALLRALQTPLKVSLTQPVELKEKVLNVKMAESVTVGNERLEVFMRDGKGREIDLDKQFGRFNAAPGGSGAGGIVTVDGGTTPGEATNYDKNVADDSVDANLNYVGEAAIGSATSASVWRVYRNDETSGLEKRWANDTDGFVHVWDDRESETY